MKNLFPRLKWGAITVGAMLLVAIPWWGPRALSHFDFFHVRRIEYEGVRYARIAELMALLQVDTLQSVWQPMEPLAERISEHAMVKSAVVSRRLPSTLVVLVEEREPVAFVEDENGLRAVDGEGRKLPIDPADTPLNIPVVAGADSAILRILAGLKQSFPAIYARISSADRLGRTDLRFMLDTVAVRTGSDVTVARFSDILPVEADLLRNHILVRELDLRFRDQVIAREP